MTKQSELKWREAIRNDFDIGLRDVIQREWIQLLLYSFR